MVSGEHGHTFIFSCHISGVVLHDRAGSIVSLPELLWSSSRRNRPGLSVKHENVIWLHFLGDLPRVASTHALCIWARVATLMLEDSIMGLMDANSEALLS